MNGFECDKNIYSIQYIHAMLEAQLNKYNEISNTFVNNCQQPQK